MFIRKTKYQYKKTKPKRKSTYRFGELHKNPVFLRLFALVFTLSFVGSLFRLMPAGAITQEQAVPITCLASGSATATCTASIVSATADNLLIIVCSGIMGGGAPTLSATGYTSAVGPTTTSNIAQEIYYKVAAGGETSVSCAIDGANNKRGLITVFEYSGMVTASIVDQVATPNTGTGTTATTGTTPTTTNANDLLIAGITVDVVQSFSSWTNSFVEQSDHSDNAAQGTAALTVSSTGAYSTGATITGTGDDWIGQVVAFKGEATTGPAYPYLTQEGYVFENDDISYDMSWHDELWSNRKKITIDNTKVPSDQTNFPVLVYRTDADWRDTANGGNVGQSDGGDILFTSSDGITKLDHEIESYVPSTGELVAWVKVPVVSGTTDTELYIYYGNASAADQWNIVGTWSNGFASVWHLDESPADGTAGGHDDSVGPNDGTPNNFQDAGGGTTSATGKINGANNFAGDNDVVTTGNSSTPTTALSLSAWVTPDVVDGRDRGIISKEDNFVFELESDLSIRCIDFSIYSGGLLRELETGDCITAGETAYFTGTYDAATRVISVYKNGSLLDTVDFGTGSENVDNNTAIPIHIGFNPFGTNRYFDGIIDEVRASNVVRSLDWIQTEYNNMDAPSTFYSVGSQETPSNTVMAGSEFSSGKTLDAVRQGERINLRTQITNSGSAFGANDELALFYDRNDGIWTKVQHNGLPQTSTGNCDSDNNFNCTTIDSSTTFGEDTDLAIDKSGNAWVSYFDSTNNEEKLRVAKYVGSGGNCTDNTWACTTVDSSVDSGDYSSVAIDRSGNPWVSYRDRQNSDLKVARYVGFGGSCTDTAWDCVTVDSSSSNVGQRTSIAFDSAGAAWISYWDFTNETLKVANYVGTGGNCTSSEWDCTTVDNAQTHVGQRTSIVIDNAGNPWVSYLELSNNNLRVANYVGSGGNCTDSAWNCTTVDSSVLTVGYYTSISVDPSGNAWVSYQDLTNTNLKVANYVGSGGNCSSSAWNCTTVDSDGANGTDSSIAFSPGGDAMVSYRDVTNTALKLAKYVGAGGNCSNSAWDCGLVDNSADVGLDTAIAFDGTGNIWISYQDTTSDNLRIASVERGGEISTVPSTFFSDGDVLSDSHSDMTSASDTTNQGDADCLAGSTTWNNGIYASSENASGLNLPAGDTTQQCTEVMWTIDTSQAVAGTTYRFVVATNDKVNDNSQWRGVTSVASDGYPTLTIRSEAGSTYVYSKDSSYAPPDCSATGWGCEAITNLNRNLEHSTIGFAPDGTAWIAAYANEVGFRDLFVAQYVGSNGTGCTTDAWECYSVLTTGEVGAQPIIAFAPDGAPWIVFDDDWTGNSDVEVARYVGSGGNCDDPRWQCEEIVTTGAVRSPNIKFDASGMAWVRYVDSTNDDLYIANYVGAGGSGCATAAWNCVKVQDAGDTIEFSPGDLLIDDNGKKYMTYIEGGLEDDLWVVEYVGAGGSGCTNPAWTCTEVSNTIVSGTHYATLDGNGDPWIAYKTQSDIVVAEYVGAGGTGCATVAWDCDTLMSSAGGSSWPRLGTDSQGAPWIAFVDDDIVLYAAQYVGGTGGTGCTSSAWDCTAVDSTNINMGDTELAFDSSGTPWISYIINSDEIGVAKMYSSPSPLSTTVVNRYNGQSGTTGHLRYFLSSGLSPYTDPYGICGGNTGLTGYCGLYHPEGHLDSLVAAPAERPMYAFSTRYDTNSYLPTGNLYFQTNTSPATQNVHLQVYRFGSTNAWETVSTYSSAGCDTANCLIRGLPSGTMSEYFEEDNGDYWVHFRVYQEESGSAMTFSVDSFEAKITPHSLRGGRVFREEISDPFGW